jgi:hypothetical protein
VGDRYIGSDRHKKPWTRGGSGTMCGDADGPALFSDAVVHPHNPRQRFCTDGVRWYRALPDDNPDADGAMTWHGHPLPPADVPIAVQEEFVRRGIIRRASLRRVIA